MLVVRFKCWYEKESLEEEGAVVVIVVKRFKTSVVRFKYSYEGESLEEEGVVVVIVVKRYFEFFVKRLYKRSYYIIRRCFVENCVFNGFNLRRYLIVYVKRGDVEEVLVDRLFLIVAIGR